MANKKVDPRFKRAPVTVTLPVWVNNSLTAHSKMKRYSKGALIEMALVEFLKLNGPERAES